MKTIKISAAAYELLKEKAKQARKRNIETFIEDLARS